jgi:hypothetical protein
MRVMAELLIARNPDPDSRLPYLMRVPYGGGLVFRTSGTWPRVKALFCFPVEATEWPAEPDVVERVAVRSCARRGASIDLVVDRYRENRSQIVFTKARGRDAVFWQSARTRKQARPDVRTPTARAAGLSDLEIIVDSRERYAYRFTGQQVQVSKRALPVGDYAVEASGVVVAAVERKSIDDLTTSLTNGKLRFALTELASLPRAAIVVESRYSDVFKLQHTRPSTVADGLAELQVRWPTVPIHFCETRQLAEEWTYRFLGAALAWARTEHDVRARLLGDDVTDELPEGPQAPAPPTAELRAWALANGLPVADRGRLRPEIVEAWRAAQRSAERLA